MSVGAAKKIFENEHGRRALESHIVYRSEFTQKILLFAHANFKTQGASDFLGYF